MDRFNKTSNDAISPRAELLLGLLTGNMGLPAREIDQGVPFIKCSEKSCWKENKPGTAGNGRLEEGEIYEAAIKLLEREEDSFVLSVGKKKRPFTNLVSRKSDFRVPWLFNDFNPKTNSDDGLLLRMGKLIAKAKAEAAAEAGSPKTENFRTLLTEKLVKRMLAEDGLALKPQPPRAPEETVVEMLAKPKPERKGACTELSRIAYGLFRLAGLAPSFVEVQKDARDAESNNHMAVAVTPDPNRPEKKLTVDMLHHGWISESGHTLQAEMPAVTSLAAYFTNKAHFEMYSGKPETKEQADKVEAIFDEAISFDPSFSLVRQNYSIFLKYRKKDDEGARREAKEAVKLRPFDAKYRKLEEQIALRPGGKGSGQDK